MSRVRTSARARLAVVVLLAGLTSACTAAPVMDPGRWSPSVYCASVRPPDPWCAAHGY